MPSILKHNLIINKFASIYIKKNKINQIKNLGLIGKANEQ
jgi:hypothetical protein